MNRFIITISRQYGSGGKTVGRMLANKLGIPCYEREIITMASEDSGINPLLFSDERLKGNFLTQLRAAFQKHGGSPVAPEYKGNIDEDVLFEHQAKVIRRLAEQGPCVMIGRCADFVLKDNPDVIRVFVHADEAFCLREAMRIDSLPEHEVQKKMTEIDAYRGAYYKHFTEHEWSDARNFDLCLNSAVLGFDGTVAAIESYMATRDAYQK